MQNFSQNEFNRIAEMRGQSRDELEQIAKIRKIKNYEEMTKEELIILIIIILIIIIITIVIKTIIIIIIITIVIIILEFQNFLHLISLHSHQYLRRTTVMEPKLTGKLLLRS